MDERLNGPRALTFGCLGGLLFWAVLLFGIAMVGDAARPFGGVR